MAINGTNIQATLQQYLQQLGFNLNGAVNNNANANNINRFTGLQTQENQAIANPNQGTETLEEKKQKHEENTNKQKEIKAKVKELIADVKAKKREAEKIQKEEIKKYQNDVDKIKEDNEKAYKEANKEGGEGMTQEQLQKNIKKAMPDAPNFAKSMALNIIIDDELEQIETLNNELDELEAEGEFLKTEITQMETAQAQQQANAQQQGLNGLAGGAGNLGNGITLPAGEGESNWLNTPEGVRWQDKQNANYQQAIEAYQQPGGNTPENARAVLQAANDAGISQTQAAEDAGATAAYNEANPAS